MVETLRKLLMGLAMAGFFAGCPGPKPPTPPTPTPPIPPGPIAGEMLLTADGPKIFAGGAQILPFMAVQCCMEAPAAVGNSRWPLASESWMDYTRPYGANFYHMRLGPFYGDAQHEGEWADVGGPYQGGPGSEFNQPFWDKVRELVKYAADHSAWVEINIIDTWYCKHAQWGDQEMPWSREAIEACGRTAGNPEQERFLRKAVSELGCFGNVIWLLDNEGDQIDGADKIWWAWQRDVIRSEEQASGCQLRHLVGAGPDFGDVGDYVYTHSKNTLVEPLWGKWTLNNERNPAGTPEREAANFAAARNAGLAWAFWRAGMTEEEMVETLQRFKDVLGGTPIGCYPPDPEGEGWKLVAPKPSCERCGLVDQIKDQLGSPCGQNPVESGERFAAAVRAAGYCAGFYKDQVSIQRPDGNWEEHHVIAWTDGCYTSTGNGYKNVWHYEGGGPGPTPPPVDCRKTLCPPGKCCKEGVGCTDCPVAECPSPVPPPPNVVNVRPFNLLFDATAKTCDRAYCQSIGIPEACCPARAEGDPNRKACEATWGAPRWDGDGDVRATDNPYQIRCKDCTWVQCCVGNACGRYEKP